MTQTYDILIIGSGIHGASLAFHLSGRGIKVAVLEKSFIAAGATGRSSGLVRMHYDIEAEARLAWESFQWFRDWKERVGGDSGFTRTGFLQIVKREYVDALTANTAMLQRIGVPTMLVTAADVKRLAPSFGLRRSRLHRDLAHERGPGARGCLRAGLSGERDQAPVRKSDRCVHFEG
jgi:sarcosine oxidase subunit beta